MVFYVLKLLLLLSSKRINQMCIKLFLKMLVSSFNTFFLLLLKREYDSLKKENAELKHALSEVLILFDPLDTTIKNSNDIFRALLCLAE